jgi:hypothetical protein
MKYVEGPLERLGDATVNMKNEYVKYSLIEIGGQVLTGLIVDRKLNNFLQDGLKTQAPTKLWLVGRKTIMGVQVGNGLRFYGKVNPFFYVAVPVFLLLIVWAFSIHWAFGAAFAFVFWFTFVRQLTDYWRIASVGGTKI